MSSTLERLKPAAIDEDVDLVCRYHGALRRETLPKLRHFNLEAVEILDGVPLRALGNVDKEHEKLGSEKMSKETVP